MTAHKIHICPVCREPVRRGQPNVRLHDSRWHSPACWQASGHAPPRRPGRPVTARGLAGARLTLRMPTELRARLDAAAEAADTTPGQLACDVLERHLPR